MRCRKQSRRAETSCLQTVLQCISVMSMQRSKNVTTREGYRHKRDKFKGQNPGSPFAAKPLGHEENIPLPESWWRWASIFTGPPVSEKDLRALRNDLSRRTCLTICLDFVEKTSDTGLNAPVGSSRTLLWVEVQKVFFALQRPLNLGCNDGHGYTTGLSLWEMEIALSTASSTACDHATRAASVW